MWTKYVKEFLINEITNHVRISAVGMSSFCSDFASQALYCTVFGVTSGAYIGLTPVVLVDLLGLDKLTNAFGLLSLFNGIASIIGPPIIGT